MSDQWDKRTIRQCLSVSFAGEWGDEPAPGNVMVLRATDIDDDAHVVGVGAERRLPASKLSAKQLADGDILLEGSGGGPDKPVGRVAFFDARQHLGPAVCSNFFKTLRPNRNVVEPRFLLRKLAWFYKQPALLAFQQQTTGIINLKFEEYLSAPIEIPSQLHEQRLIAQILDTLDTAIRETEAIIAKLKAVKQGLLHDLLTRGIDANGEPRPPQAEAPHLYKQSPLGWIPKEWGCAPLREYAGVTVAYVGPTNPFYTDQEHGILFLRTGNITDDGIDLSDVRWVTKAFHLAQKKSALLEGDVVVSRVGYTGTASVVGGLGDVNAANMIIIRPLQVLHPQWVRRLFGADAYIKQVSGFTAGSAQPVLNIDLVYRLITPLPPTSEQALIIERLDASDFRIKSERAELAAMCALKAGLMDDLLTGRVRVSGILGNG